MSTIWNLTHNYEICGDHMRPKDPTKGMAPKIYLSNVLEIANEEIKALEKQRNDARGLLDKITGRRFLEKT